MTRRGVLLLAVVLLGRPSEDLPRPETLPACEALASAERKVADEAWTARDAKAAERAARRAEAGAERAQELVAAQRKTVGEAFRTTDPGLLAAEASLSSTEQAARGARRFANLAAEAEELDDQVNGLTGRAYGKVSDLAVKAVFKGLQVAAQQAAKAKEDGSLDQLPEQARGTAELAARIAVELGTAGPSQGASEDWGSVALAMAAYTVDTPERTHLLLALALTILGKDGFALYELEALDPSKLDLTTRFGFHLLRGVVYRMNGYPLLAGLELEVAAALSGQLLEDADQGTARAQEIEELGPSLLSGVHVLLACYYLDQKELTKADQQIARAIRVWPENPLAVYLTGERLAASGEWEQAAESLERSAAGTEGEYMAKKIAERAREVRDAKGETPPLMSDKRFLVEATLWYVGQAAKQSKAAERLKETMDGAQQFGARMLARAKELGGFGGGADDDAEQDGPERN